MDAIGFLESIKASEDYRGQLTHIERIARRSAKYGEVMPPVSGGIGDALRRQGITRLYCHQAEAFEAVRAGENIIVVTATASGKTLCYNIPVAEALEADPSARALYVYPTKALAQDQLGKLKQYQLPFLRPATYDGDTPREQRGFVKAAANLVLTNPDMLHVGILPYHATWAAMFRNLKYVVLDEVHSYRGIFGSHMANIIRRLRRIAAYYGSHPQFICASATVRDPLGMATGIIGLPVRVIDDDGSPSGRRVFAFWNPPHLAQKGERRSANSEAVDLLTTLISNGVRTLVFTKARKTAELILRYARTWFKDHRSDLGDRIMSYRAGYRPEERREIERRLFSGELLGVTSTNALEVGVDIGGLDAVVITGYPGTVTSTWQQAGRAGRSDQESLAVLIAHDDPMDQFLMRSPDYFFHSQHELTIVDPQNPYVLADHILCAAYELPIENREVEELFGERAWEILGMLGDVGWVTYRTRWYWNGSDYPARNVNIRSTSSETYTIVSLDHGGAIIGTADAPTAFETVHQGAIYLHAGESYIVSRLDLLERNAYVTRTDVNYYTTPGSRTRIAVCEEIENRRVGGGSASFGDVRVGTQVTHYWRKQLFTERVIDKAPLDLPELELNTEAVWIRIPQSITNRLTGREFDLTGAIHAIEHAAIGLMPLFVLCDRNDIGGVSHPGHPDTDFDAAIFIYDGHDGGVGLARGAYDLLEDLLSATLRTIEDCSCEDGCPSCVQSPKCGNNNEPLDKAGAVFLLRELLEGEATRP